MLAALCIAAASCVYPFEPEVSQTDGRLVIEGDLLLGSVSSISLSYLSELDADNTSVRLNCPSRAQVWVESEDGKAYPAVRVSSTKNLAFDVDLTQAPQSGKYRLCVLNEDTGREYVSFWQEPMAQAVVIDKVSYEIDPDIPRANFKISFHSTDPSIRHFRLSYREDWEFHSEYKANVRYVSPDEKGYFGSVNGTILGGYDEYGYNYYCWSSTESDYISLVSTEDYVNSEIVDMPFRSVNGSDRRVSMLYCLTPYVYPMTKDAYEYYDHLNSVSSFDGSLFAPNPSEMRGNIRCVSDTTEMVIGYVEITAPATQHFFFPAEKLGIYTYPKPVYSTEFVAFSQGEWYTAYKQGYLPFSYDPIQGSQWADWRCVDCRATGGTKNKPSYWPNDDE